MRYCSPPDCSVEFLHIIMPTFLCVEKDTQKKALSVNKKISWGYSFHHATYANKLYCQAKNGAIFLASFLRITLQLFDQKIVENLGRAGEKKAGDLLKNFAVRNFSFDLVFNFFFSYTFRAEQNIFVRSFETKPVWTSG